MIRVGFYYKGPVYLVDTVPTAFQIRILPDCLCFAPADPTVLKILTIVLHMPSLSSFRFQH